MSEDTKMEGLLMSTKDAVLELIRKLPDDVTVPDIMAELYVRQTIDEGFGSLMLEKESHTKKP
jgi:hypothetical protein